MPIQTTTPEGDAFRQAQTSTPLDNLTPAQIDTWINTNVTDVASIRTALKYVAKALIAEKKRADRLEQVLRKHIQGG
jgi:hypothetical protein